MPDKVARIDLRVSADLKAESERAAACEGETLTRFVEDAIRRRIREVRQRRERTLLSARDQDVFLSILDQEEPSEALRRSARKYRDLIDSGDLHVGDRAVPGGP